MSSSLPLSFNSLHSWQKSSRIPSDFTNSTFTFPNFNNHTSLTLSKSHICFTFNSNNSDFSREEQRWMREEQRWLREEQRWLREEKRWEAEREALLNEIESLKLQIEEVRREGGNGGSVSNVVNLLRVLKKEVNQIAESGSSAAPLVVEAAAAVDDVEEVVVKEVVRVAEVAKERGDEREVKKRTTLRVGSEGDQVRMLQEALLKLGFYCGEEDEEFSSFSSGTERAVKTWQASIGVPETGMVTADLLERLYMEKKEGPSGFEEGANGATMTSVTRAPEIPSRIEKEDPETDVSKTDMSEHRVFLLGENRWEDSSRLTNRNKDRNQSQTDSKGVTTTRCITCRGEGRLMCIECDGTGEPNIEPQFLEWVGEDTKCPYCEGHGYTTCDVCRGAGVTRA